MEYLSHSRSHPFELYTNYNTNLSSTTNFPDISKRHDDFMRTNIQEFYKQPSTLRRSMTTLDGFSLGGQGANTSLETHPRTIVPLIRRDKSVGVRSSLQELEGLKCVPRSYSTNRTALYTRYTMINWSDKSQNLYGNSDKARTAGELMRGESMRLGRQLDELTSNTQQDSTKKLGTRKGDVDNLKKELDNEIANSISESDNLTQIKLVLEKALHETENPLAAAQQCLYAREKRAQIDLVHDNVEKELLNEIEVIKECQNELSSRLNQAGEQLKNNRLSQTTLQNDSKDKYQALKLDERANNLKNHSAGLAYHHGIQYVNTCKSTPETWNRFTQSNINDSVGERDKSAQLRAQINIALQRCQERIHKQWNTVNEALSSRIQEVMNARNGDQEHLKKIYQEIFDAEKTIEYLKKAVIDKQAPLKVAQSRLNIRLDRPNMEACNDAPRNRLIEEIKEIEQSLASLQSQLRQAESVHHNLLLNKADLEHDLAIKNQSIFIDREECLGTRRTFMVNWETLKHK